MDFNFNMTRERFFALYTLFNAKVSEASDQLVKLAKVNEPIFSAVINGTTVSAEVVISCDKCKVVSKCVSARGFSSYGDASICLSDGTIRFSIALNGTETIIVAHANLTGDIINSKSVKVIAQNKNSFLVEWNPKLSQPVYELDTACFTEVDRVVWEYSVKYSAEKFLPDYFLSDDDKYVIKLAILNSPADTIFADDDWDLIDFDAESEDSSNDKSLGEIIDTLTNKEEFLYNLSILFDKEKFNKYKRGLIGYLSYLYDKVEDS